MGEVLELRAGRAGAVWALLIAVGGCGSSTAAGAAAAAEGGASGTSPAAIVGSGTGPSAAGGTAGSAQLTGAAAVDGEGSVALRDAQGGQSHLAALHDGWYSTLVIPGTYDLVYRLDSEGTDATNVPINRLAVLQEGIVVGAFPLTLDASRACPRVGRFVPQTADGLRIL